MNSKNILIGEVRKCTNYDEVVTIFLGEASLGHYNLNSKLFEENMVMLDLGNDRYVDIRKLNPILQASLFFDKLIYPDGSNLVEYPNNCTMGTSPICKGDLFVVKNTLRSYYTESKDISLMQLKRELWKK